MAGLARFLYRFRYILLVVVLLITARMASLIDIKMDNSIGAWFSKENPDYVRYRDFCDTFEDGRFIIIGLRTGDVFTREVLQYIRDKTEALENLGASQSGGPEDAGSGQAGDEVDEFDLLIGGEGDATGSGQSGKELDEFDLLISGKDMPEESTQSAAPDRQESSASPGLTGGSTPPGKFNNTVVAGLVKQVHSLANANKIVGTSEGIEITPLLQDLESASLESIRKRALDDELFNGYLVSADATCTTIVVAFQDMTVTETDRAVAAVEAIIYQDRPTGLDIFFCGDIMMMSEFNRYAKQNQTIFPLLIMIIITAFMYILFRSFSRVVIVLAVVGVCLCWALGFNCILGFSVNVVTGMLIPLVIILSIADCIHIIEYFDEVRGEGAGEKEAFIETVRYITIPCFITSVTTAIGLVSLATSPIEAVKNFGIGSAAGIMFAFIVSILMVPLLLTLVPGAKKLREAAGWERLLKRISRVNDCRTSAVLVVTVLGFIVFGLGIAWMQVETNQMEWFPKDSPFYLASMEIDRNLSGAGDLEVLISGGAGTLKNPAVLKRMDMLSDEIKDYPLVEKILSLPAYIKRINMALHDDNPAENRVPDRQALIAQELFLFSLSDAGRRELERMTTTDYARGRIAVKIRIQATRSRDIVDLAYRIEKRGRELFAGSGVTVHVNGISFMYNILYKYLLESQVKSFAIAFVLVTVILFVIFRSARYGFLSITPNLLPIIFIIGLMGWLGITLNVGTVMVASVALGIALDDTIHYLTRFRKELDSARFSIRKTASLTTVFTGKAIIFTSVVNIAGFLVPMLSGFQPTRQFGLLVAMTLAFALAADLFVLPASIIATSRILIGESSEDTSEE